MNLLLEKLNKLDVKYNFKQYYLYKILDLSKDKKMLDLQQCKNIMEKSKIRILHFQGNKEEQAKKLDLMHIIKTDCKFINTLR